MFQGELALQRRGRIAFMAAVISTAMFDAHLDLSQLPPNRLGRRNHRLAVAGYDLHPQYRLVLTMGGTLTIQEG